MTKGRLDWVSRGFSNFTELRAEGKMHGEGGRSSPPGKRGAGFPRTLYLALIHETDQAREDPHVK